MTEIIRITEYVDKPQSILFAVEQVKKYNGTAEIKKIEGKGYAVFRTVEVGEMKKDEEKQGAWMA